MDSLDQRIPMPSMAVMNPATAQGPEQDPVTQDPKMNAEPQPRNEEFDTKMREFAMADAKDLMNEKLSTDEYIKRSLDREADEYKMLEEYKKDATLSATQRAELEARMQMIDYNRNANDIQDAYMKDPNDPAAKAAYDTQEKDLKEYRKAMQDAPEFQDSPAMERMRNLEKELEGTKTPEDEKRIKMEMNEAMRDFKKELIEESRTEEGAKAVQERVLGFIERNKDNTVIKESGMLAAAVATRARKAEMGQDKEESLENQQSTPNGAAKAGGVEAENPMAKDAADKEVAGAKDNGKDGQIAPVRADVIEADNSNKTPTAAAGQPQQAGAGMGM